MAGKFDKGGKCQEFDGEIVGGGGCSWMFGLDASFLSLISTSD